VNQCSTFFSKWRNVIGFVLVFGSIAAYASYSGASDAAAAYEAATGKHVSVWSAMWKHPEIPPSVIAKRRSAMRARAASIASAAAAVMEKANLLILKIDEGSSVERYDEDLALGTKDDMEERIDAFVALVSSEEDH